MQDHTPPVDGTPTLISIDWTVELHPAEIGWVGIAIPYFALFWPAAGQILGPRCVGARRRIGNFAGRSHEHRLKKNRGGHGAEERKGHHLAHARCARISREPKAPKGCRCRQRAECHGPRQARLQQVRFAGSPRHDVIDLECHAHAKQQRRGDDIGEVESQAKRGSTRRRRPGAVCSATAHAALSRNIPRGAGGRRRLHLSLLTSRWGNR
jgi:hypothetical protein